MNEKEQWLSKALDQQLTDTEKDLFLNELKEDPQLSQQYLELTRLDQAFTQKFDKSSKLKEELLLRTKFLEDKKGFKDSVLKELNKETTSKPHSLPAWFKMAALFLCGLFLGQTINNSPVNLETKSSISSLTEVIEPPTNQPQPFQKIAQSSHQDVIHLTNGLPIQPGQTTKLKANKKIIFRGNASILSGSKLIAKIN